MRSRQTKPSGSASYYWTRRTGLNSVGRSPRATSFIATRFPRHSGKPLKVKTARGEIKDDPAFRPTEIYHREATAHVDGKDLPEMGEVLVTYQGYRENTVCYSPITKSRSISPRFSSTMRCWSPIKGVERTKFAISPITKSE